MRHFFKIYFKKIRYFLEYLTIITFFLLPIKLLPKKLLPAIASCMGFFIYLVPPLRKILISNIKTAYPKKNISEIREIARKSVNNVFLSFLDFSWFVIHPDKLDEYFEFPDEAWKIFQKNKEKNKGIIFVTPHLGNWEVAGLKIKRTGIPFAVVVRQQTNPYLHKLINYGRSSEGAIIINAKGAIKKMIRALKEGYLMATLIDQNTRLRDGGIFVNFFGLPVPTSRAPAMFGRKMAVPLVVGGCIRKGNKYVMFGKELSKNVEEYSSDKEIIQELMTITEELVRKYPDQYLWLYKRFQNIPREADENMIDKYPYYAKLTTERFYTRQAKYNS